MNTHEAEKTLIALAVKDQYKAAELCTDFSAADFTRWGETYSLINKRLGEGKATDMISLSDSLSPDALSELAAAFAIQSGWEPAKAIVKDASRRRKFTAGMKAALEMAAGEDGYEDAAQAVIDGLDDMQSTVRPVGGDAMTAYLNIWNDRDAVLTGFEDYDGLTGGLGKGELIVLAARPSMGKTSLAVNMAINIVLYGGVAAICSLEMTGEQLLRRAIIGMAMADPKDAGDEDVRAILEAATKLSNAKLYVSDRSSVSAADVRAYALKIKRTEKRLDLVVIDYLQLMAVQKADTRDREIAETTRALKLLAKELNCPVLLLSQLNRAVESRADKSPMLSDLRDSGTIEQDADQVLMLTRPVVYDRTADRHKAELWVRKNRQGATGPIRLQWFGEFFLFANHVVTPFDT